jgi:hypothetical protein
MVQNKDILIDTENYSPPKETPENTPKIANEKEIINADKD